MMHVSVWFEFYNGLFSCQISWYLTGKCDNKEGNSNWAHPFPRVLEHKKESDVTESIIYELLHWMNERNTRILSLTLSYISKYYKQYTIGMRWP